MRVIAIECDGTPRRGKASIGRTDRLCGIHHLDDLGGIEEGGRKLHEGMHVERFGLDPLAGDLHKEVEDCQCAGRVTRFPSCLGSVDEPPAAELQEAYR